MFNQLIGKTIVAAEQMTKENIDDDGWLKLTFSDGTHVVIVAYYGGHTGGSEDEYPTGIMLADDLSGLIPVGETNG